MSPQAEKFPRPTAPLFWIILLMLAGISASADPLTITSPICNSKASYREGLFVYFQPKAQGGYPPYYWSFNNLPPNLRYDSAAQGLLGYIGPRTAGDWTTEVVVTDAAGTHASCPFTFQIFAGYPLRFTGPTALPAAIEGTPYASPLKVFSVQDGVAPYTYSAAGVPPGLRFEVRLDSSAYPDRQPGLFLVGTPPIGSIGLYTVRFTATDAAGTSKTIESQLAVNSDLRLEPVEVQPATEFAPYPATQFSANGSVGYHTWTVVSGLPPGMTLSSRGVLSGTPAARSRGDYQLTLKAEESPSRMAIKSWPLTVRSCLSGIAPSGRLPDGWESQPYGPVTFTMSGCSGGYTWSAEGLPAGLTLSTGGVLSGTVGRLTAGEYYGTVHMYSPIDDLTSRADFGLTIRSGLIITSPATSELGSFALNDRIGPIQFAAVNGKAPLSWSIVAGSLPAGISLSSAGVLSGTVAETAGRRYPFSVRVTDSSGHGITGDYSITILSTSRLQITWPSDSLPSVRTLAPYGPYTCKATGGSGEGYRWFATGLPAYLPLTPEGVLGPWTAPGSSANLRVTFTVTDSRGNSASKTVPFSIYGELSLTTTELPNADVGQPYGPFQLSALGGDPPYRFENISWTPSGLELDPSGVIQGRPLADAAGRYSLLIRVRDASAKEANAYVSLLVRQGRVLLAVPEVAPQASVGVPYSDQLLAKGGCPPYQWRVDSALPPGLRASSEGLISGTPTSLGTWALNLSVSDCIGDTATGPYRLTVVNPPLTITTPDPLPAATEGHPYPPLTLQAVGGSGGYRWTANPLPAGMTLSEAGVLSGTPGPKSAAYYYMLVVRVTDSQNQSVAKGLYLLVGEPRTLSISPGTLSPGAIHQPYGPVTFTATGGVAPYQWSVISGELPNGISLNPNGQLGGQPAAGTPGSYPITIRATDSRNASATISLTLTILGESLAVTCTPAPGPDARSVPYSTSCVAKGGTAPYTWSVTGTLPDGLAINRTTGVLSGTPTAAGPYSFTVVATDSAQPPTTGYQRFAGSVKSSLYTVSPASLTFRHQPGAPPPPQTVRIPESGFTYSVTPAPGLSCPWLTVSPAEGSTPVELQFAVNTDGLRPGTYSCNAGIAVKSATSSGVPVTNIPVTLTVDGPALTATPQTVTFTSAGTQTINLASTTDAPIAFTATPGCGWLTVDPTSGTTPATLTLTASTAAPPAATCPLVIGAPLAATLPQPSAIWKPATTTLTASPAAIQLAATEGSTTPVSTTVTINGPDPVTPTIENAPWLTVEPTSAVPPAVLRVTANPTGRAAGAYPAVIRLNTEVSVPVTFTIAAVTYRAVPSSLSFRYEEGTEPPTQDVALLASDGSTPELHLATTGPIQATRDATVHVSVTPGLQAGTYSGSLTLTTGVTVPVSITVTPKSTALMLEAAPTAVSFGMKQGATPASRMITVAARGGSWTPAAIIRTDSAASWLSVTGLPATAASGEPVPITITADPKELTAAGVFTGVVILRDTASGQEIRVPVTLTLNARPALILSRPSLSLSGGPALLDILNTGADPLAWTASFATLSGGAWLQLDSDKGTVKPGQAATLTLSVDPAARLDAGTYYGAVEVRAEDAANSPQIAGVVLEVGTARPALRPASLIFRESGEQTLVLTNPVAYSAATSATWCTVTPTAGTANPVIRVETGSLTPGPSLCTVRFAFDDGTAQQVEVVAINSRACKPGTHVVTLREPVWGSLWLDTQPVPMEAEVRDNCGEPVSDTTVAGLRPVGNGLYRGSWTPTPLALDVPEQEVGLRATTPLGASTETPIVIRRAAADPPRLDAPAATAPCALLTLTGAALTGDSGETHIYLGSTALTILRATVDRIDTQIPCATPPNTTQSLRVVRGAQQSAPVDITIATAAPVLLTTTGQPIGQARAFWTTPDIRAVVADAANPVARGATLELLATGLGTGMPRKVDVIVGGVPAESAQATVIAGEVGLYRITFPVPAAAPSGAAIPVQAVVDGYATLPGVTIAVH